MIQLNTLGNIHLGLPLFQRDAVRFHKLSTAAESSNRRQRLKSKTFLDLNINA